MANKIGRVPVREQDPKVRATNFEEVCYGYNVDDIRCLRKQGYKNTKGKRYPGMRHEILRERDKETVWKDILAFLQADGTPIAGADANGKCDAE